MEVPGNALHPSLSGRHLVFSAVSANNDIWSLPLDAATGAVAGQAQRLTRLPAEDLSPSVSAEGRSIVFLSNRSRASVIWVKDSAAAREKEVAIAGPTNRVKISPAGTTAFYRVLEGEGVQKQAVYATDLASARTRRVCADCGTPTHVTPDERILVYETGSALARLGAVRLETGEKWEFLEHSHHALKSARISPDVRWLAFQLDRGFDGKQIYVAPFLDARPGVDRTWTAITEAQGSHEEPWWSPGGEFLYYLSDRDGWRCVWGQPFDGRSGSAGKPVAIQHFHSVRRTPLSLIERAPLYVGLSVAKDRLVFSLTEVASDLWMAEIP